MAKRVLAHLNRMAGSTDQEHSAERQFWNTPDLVVKLLPFLDPSSVLTLCACFEEESVDRVVMEIENSQREEDEWSVLEKVLSFAEEQLPAEEEEEEEEEDWTGLEQFLDLTEYQSDLEEQEAEILL